MRLNPITGHSSLRPRCGDGGAVAMAGDAVKKPDVPLEKTVRQVAATQPMPSPAVVNPTAATLDGSERVLTSVTALRWLV